MGSTVEPIDRDGQDLLRRASLRRQVALLETLRDAMAAEPEADYDRIAAALIPTTDAVLHELMALEGRPPYPHPFALEWWRPPYAGNDWDPESGCSEVGE